MMRTRLVITAVAAAILLGLGVAPAVATPNPNASCAAQLGAHGELGNPGGYQRTNHDPTFGLRAVKVIAMLDDCSAPE